MKRTCLVIFSVVVILEGLAANLFLWQMEFDAGRGQIVNYAALRLILTVLSMILLLGLSGFVIVLFLRKNFAIRVCNSLDGWLIGLKGRLFFVQGAITLLTVLLTEGFLVTYLAIPVPMRPIMAWAALTSVQVWILFRLVYAPEYRKRPSLTARLREKWNEWLPVQRKTFLILSLMGLIYFIGFMPSNFMLDDNGHFYTHPDEAIIYPDIARVLVWQGNFSDVVHLVIEDWQWWYGYPYLPLSAMVLVLPRLILGSNFASNIQVNMFLLRQFISVLPMILSLMLIVYLVNRFRSLWQSVLLFVFLALVPGVLIFNHRFWHPDGIVILLILLTFYFLEKDRLRYGKYFYLAAASCGLTTAIKLWGVFFVLAIGGYLIAGWLCKRLTFKKTVLLGLGFLLTMTGTIIITSPGLIAPYIRNGALNIWTRQQNSLLNGYQEPDPWGAYATGLKNWLRFFGYYFMKPYFFFFAFFSLITGSLWGKRKTINRLILAWSVPAAVFLINFAAMKNFQYMFPLMMPLFLAALMFPMLVDESPESKGPAFLKKPLTRKILWGITAAVCLVQFVINYFEYFSPG